MILCESMKYYTQVQKNNQKINRNEVIDIKLKYYNLDCFRGYAMLLVILFHYNKSIMPKGFIGVDIFLCFLVNTLSSSNIQRRKDFYSKRIIRLYPFQIACLLLIFKRHKAVKVVNF